MLVLSRKLNETIIIDGNIRVTVVAINGNQIRLGIEAPREVGIYREELCVPIEMGHGNVPRSEVVTRGVRHVAIPLHGTR